jgi:outer membrane immunogenic protein
MILRTTATTLAIAFAFAPAVQAQDWTGAYGGIQIGSANSNDTGIFALDPLPPGGALATAFSPNDALPDRGFSGAFDSGVVAGAHFGYDIQVGNLVYGGVMDLNHADFGDVQEGRSRTPATYTIGRSMDFLATLRGRGGYLVSPSTLIYGTAGLALGDVDFSYAQPGSGATTVTSGGQDSNIGYVVGLGIENMVTDKISVGLEYLYVNMGGNDFNANLTGGPFSSAAPSTNATGSDEDFDFGTLQLRVSYRF